MRAEHFFAPELRKEQNTCIFDKAQIFLGSLLAD